jgi:hypothetical protein
MRWSRSVGKLDEPKIAWRGALTFVLNLATSFEYFVEGVGIGRGGFEFIASVERH